MKLFASLAFVLCCISFVSAQEDHWRVVRSYNDAQCTLLAGYTVTFIPAATFCNANGGCNFNANVGAYIQQECVPTSQSNPNDDLLPEGWVSMTQWDNTTPDCTATPVRSYYASASDSCILYGETFSWKVITSCGAEDSYSLAIFTDSASCSTDPTSTYTTTGPNTCTADNGMSVQGYCSLAPVATPVAAPTATPAAPVAPSAPTAAPGVAPVVNQGPAAPVANTPSKKSSAALIGLNMMASVIGIFVLTL